jgi:hypothetical protein
VLLDEILFIFVFFGDFTEFEGFESGAIFIMNTLVEMATLSAILIRVNSIKMVTLKYNLNCVFHPEFLYET